MRVLFYRDKKAVDTITIARITKDGVQVADPYRIETSWKLEFYEKKTNEFWRPMRIL